jgi:predicted RND superfamily exporter protein
MPVESLSTVRPASLATSPWRFPFLAAVMVVTGLLGWQALKVGIEKDNASLNTRDAEQMAVYDALVATFGSDEDIIVAVRHPRLVSEEGIGFVADLTRRIGAIPGVLHVISLANAEQIVAGEFGAEPAPLIARPVEEATAAAALDRNPQYDHLLVSRDRTVAGLLVELDAGSGRGGDPAPVIDAMRALVAAPQAAGVEIHMSGIAVQKNDVSRLVDRDQRRLVPLAVIILAITLAFFFRRPAGVVLPLAVTGVSVVWTLGLYGLAGLKINAITALLPPILMVLSVTISVHLMQGWVRSAVPGGDRGATIDAVVRHLWAPCLFCSLTTGLGFASLAVSDTPAVRNFGIFAAAGVVIAFVAAMTLIPIGLARLAPRELRGNQSGFLDRVLEGCADLATTWPRAVLAVFLVVTVAAVLTIPLVRNNTDLVGFLHEDEPLYRDTLFIDRELMGANAVELLVERQDGGVLATADAVQRLAALEAAILQRPGVDIVLSVLPVLRQIHRAETGGDTLRLPSGDADVATAFDLLEAGAEQPLVRKVISGDLTQARLSVRLRSMGTADAAPLIEEFVADGRRILGDAYRLVPTGAFHHVVRDSNHLVIAQLESFSLALLLVFLAIGFLFRSPRLTLLSLVPNTAPILWTGGLMGLFGIDLSTGTVMIASAVLGLVVDDTIHFLTQYTRLYDGDGPAAVRGTMHGIGRALVMNNLVLVLGFWVGCFGSFKPTVYFSLFSGVTMISALLCDLLVTPACLLLFGGSGLPREDAGAQEQGSHGASRNMS